MVLEESGLPVCTSLWQCFLATADRGLRSGDMGSVFTPLPSPDIETLTQRAISKFYIQAAFAFTFWFLVIIILLNAVFGIIIDSFGELRAVRKEIKKKNEDECFICGIDRFRLDTKGGGFSRHIHEHHNMWNYLRMIVMLREKDATDQNGWETWVWSRIMEEDTVFLPQDALSLKALTEQELAKEQSAAAQSAKTASVVADVAASLVVLREQLDTLQQNQALTQEELLRLGARLGSTVQQLVIPRQPTSTGIE